MAIFDWTATALAAALIGGMIWKINPGVSYACASIIVFVILILVAIIVGCNHKRYSPVL